jgi:histone-lysine N-methyltransferase SETMAR
LHEELDMKKLCARCVPRLLTADQKHTRMKISQQCLERFNKNKTDFVCRFITMDKSCIHHYTPESKQQSKQWTETKEDKVGSISRKGHGIGVLGC